jgi:hypothetical protein
VTLIASVNGPETIWLIADRRISWAPGRWKDDAQKVMLLRTVDGAAILAYAGLGVTAQGTEPSSWMQAVLHKRALPLQESLSTLANAMERELPRHLNELPAASRTHVVLAPAFYGTWEGSIARLYTIDLMRCADHQYHFVFQVHDMANTGVPPPVAMGGSGGRVLFQLMKDPKWRSPLRRLVEACARQRIPAHAVADYLARLCHEVHKVDPSVGPRCIVVWKHRLGGRRFGGGYLYYTRATREHDTPQLALAPPLVDAGAAGFYRVMRRHFANEPGEPPSGARVIRIRPAPTNDVLESEINVEMGLPPAFPEEKLP